MLSCGAETSQFFCRTAGSVKGINYALKTVSVLASIVFSLSLCCGFLFVIGYRLAIVCASVVETTVATNDFGFMIDDPSVSIIVIAITATRSENNAAKLNVTSLRI